MLCLPLSLGAHMEVTYLKFDRLRAEWNAVTSLEEIPVEAIPHVFALRHNEDFECQDFENLGTRFRAIWAAQDLKEYSFNPMAAKLCLRLQQAELDVQYWKEQVGNAAERDARFKKIAGMRRDEIQKALMVLTTLQAEAFEGSHNERHTKLARAIVQVREVSALCEKIPDLLVDAANDIPF